MELRGAPGRGGGASFGTIRTPNKNPNQGRYGKGKPKNRDKNKDKDQGGKKVDGDKDDKSNKPKRKCFGCGSEEYLVKDCPVQKQQQPHCS